MTAKPKNTYPVVIVGGGMAGVTAARTLAAAGVPVVLYERSEQLGGRLGTIDVGGELVGALHEGMGGVQLQDPRGLMHLLAGEPEDALHVAAQAAVGVDEAGGGAGEA